MHLDVWGFLFLYGTMGSGLLLVMHFQVKKKSVSSYTNTDILLKTSVWVICIFWQNYPWQRILWSMAGFHLKPGHHEMLICVVQDPRWIYALEIFILRHLSCVPECWTQIFIRLS